MYTLLIAEDEKGTRETVREYFGKRGFEIWEAADGIQAAAMIEERDFDIVRVEKTDTFKDAWRIFGAEADRPAKELPRCTSMQRAFADFLAAGGQTGEGFGIILWGDQGQLA